MDRATDQMPDSVKALLPPHAIVAIVFATLALAARAAAVAARAITFVGRAKRAAGCRKVRRAQAREQKSKLIEERNDFDPEDDYDNTTTTSTEAS